MNKELRRAEEWLNRNYGELKRLDADKRTLEVLSARVGARVGKLDRDGTESHDAAIAQARHEDSLFDYSIQAEKVEKETRAISQELEKTRKAIDELGDKDLEAVAIDRYINRFRWKDIAKFQHISEAEAYRRRIRMLEKMALILREGNY